MFQRRTSNKFNVYTVKHTNHVHVQKSKNNHTLGGKPTQKGRTTSVQTQVATALLENVDDVENESGAAHQLTRKRTLG